MIPVDRDDGISDSMLIDRLLLYLKVTLSVSAIRLFNPPALTIS
jgi:hypothetical protein